MSIKLRMVLILGALCNTNFVLQKIKKSKLKIEDSVFWIFFSLILILLALFPGITGMLATVFGVQSPVNLLYLVILFIVLVRLFHLSIQTSSLEEKVKELTQQLAIEKNRREENTTGRSRS